MHQRELMMLPHLSRGAGQTGFGQTADSDIQGALNTALAPNAVGNTISAITQQVGADPNAVAATLGQYSSGAGLATAAQGAMQNLANGQAADLSSMIGLTSINFPVSSAQNIASQATGAGFPPVYAVALGVVATAIPALTPVVGVEIAALEIAKALWGFFQKPPPPTITYCSALNYQGAIPQGETIPSGPGDTAAWRPYPLALGQETCQFSCADPDAVSGRCGAVDPNSRFGVGSEMTTAEKYVWCLYQIAPTGTFEQFAAAALLANYALGWNCQGSFVSPMKLIQQCANQWNGVHAGPLVPIAAVESTPQNPNPSVDPTNILGAIAGAAIVYDTPQSGGDVLVNRGPMIVPKTGPVLTSTPIVTHVNLPGGGTFTATGNTTPPTSTATKVAIGAGAVVGAAALTVAIVAVAKGWALGKAADWVWAKTGGKVVDALK
jgi:hypothetical protein